MERGYVKLYRSIDQNELLENDNTALIVFVKLLTRADRRTGAYRTGRLKFAHMCNMKPSTVRDALKRLEATTVIRQQSDSRATTIYICNWDKYQQQDDSRPSSQRRTDDTKQEKKEKENNIYMSNSDELRQLHDWICKLFDKNPTRFKLSDARRQKLKVRLNDFGDENLKKAFVAISGSDFHRGNNKTGWSIDTDPYWLLSSYEKTEKWVNGDTEGSNFGDGQIDIKKLNLQEPGNA